MTVDHHYRYKLERAGEEQHERDVRESNQRIEDFYYGGRPQ